MREFYIYCLFISSLIIHVNCQFNQGDGSFPPPPPLPTDNLKSVSTKITTEVSTVYKTVVYTSSASPVPTVYNITNTGGGHQEQDPSTSNVSDPNNGSIQSSIANDQSAVKKMILIISLVGGIGAIALITTIVIFTRMRAKNKNQQETSDNTNVELSRQPPEQNSAGNDDDDSTDHDFTPSAPPALLLASQEPHPHRRTMISMSSQTNAPTPSAPPAKELLQESSSSDQVSIDNCSQWAPLAREIPPPAYTPSAPPEFLLPVVSPFRRHSLGG